MNVPTASPAALQPSSAFADRRRTADRITDTAAEVGGSLFGKQTLRVWGIGDINRKSIGGTVSGFAACLVFCLWIVLGRGLPLPWIGLAVVIAVSNTLLELLSPRGTDDFTMATANALVCWAFGALVL